MRVVLRASLGLFMLSLFSSTNVFADKPLIEYWKAPVIGLWKGEVYSNAFYRYSQSKPSFTGKEWSRGAIRAFTDKPIYKKYSLLFQLDSQKKISRGKFVSDDDAITGDVVTGTFRGKYTFYTSGKFKADVIVFCRYDSGEYVFPVKFTGRFDAEGKIRDFDVKGTIKGKGSLNATHINKGIILGGGSFSRKRF